MNTNNLAIATQIFNSVDPSEWLWTGENYPKLISKTDKSECNVLEVLAEEYSSNTNIWKTHQECGAESDEIEPYQRRAVYCKKRYAKITRDFFSAGSFVSVGGELGTVKPYPDKSSPQLQKVEIELNNGSIIKRNPTQIELAPRIDKQAKIIEFCSSQSNTKSVAISDIIRNSTTQQRIGLNHETVKEYAEAMQSGDRFPPVKLISDGKQYWITDGHHTTEAAWSIGHKFVDATITQGTERDAILIATGVNADHGLRRNNSDKRKAVTTLLEDSEWSQWSDRKIARHCKVSQPFVSKLRSSLTDNVISDNPKKYIDKYGNESVMNTANIGSAQQQLVNDPNFPLNPEAKQLSIEEVEGSNAQPATSPQPLSATGNSILDGYEVGQIVQINSDRSDKRLVGFNDSFAVITAVNCSTVNIKSYGDRFTAVSINDLQIVDREKIPLPVVCIGLDFKEYAKVLTIFDSKEEIIKAAIAAGSLAL